MKFIHAADIHLDSPLHGLSAYPDAPAAQLRNASRDALRQLVDRAIEEEVAFLVIAGDLYDGDWKDHNTGIFFGQQMGRLRKAGIRAFVLWGNHDAESEMTRKLTLPDNVTVFGHRKPEVHRLPEFNVALHGQSFKDKAVVENLAIGYPEPVSGCYNIGVLHTALEGHTAHASYAPCTLAELHAKGYDYWALGHVHEFQQWSGPSTIVFPGNLQGRYIRETGRRGAVLVTVEGGETRVERLYLDVLRWEAVEVDAADCVTIADLARKIGQSLEALLTVDGHVPRAVRVTITGRTPAHGLFFGRATQLRAEVLNQIGIIGNERLWLEKVKVATSAMDLSHGETEQLEALEDLKQILADAAHDPEFLALLERDLKPFVGKVRSEVKEEVPLLSLARSGELTALVQQVGTALLARLAQGE
ncbi:metallophosphoesterase family protein [Burkholderia ubonensis]|uniref:metallophosphoesterase family protein n=1 Tax=Burkholderia ubonensis TaxID=101571 RepID=UPI000BA77B54|nr:DNA repair exonuclease [Burkholderia ubonensis]PAK13098.1 DNA repair exonuclease [Burkholderia ubonensis]RQP28276.1 DNA repair exonuclease [Burkholderia ubonensis]RQP30671.1 DNA repair exonuclease [Burkholderia ubonensis]RQP32982.1 DNA repair exonuclease [Burkholderia ubonensis]RQP48375.1 DNA repair exonuclease [Burkholderia ubonensis]